MRRIVIDRPGGYDRLRLVEEPDPSPAAGEVLIDVDAAGVNYADSIVRMGLYASANKLHGYPITPGFEVAGRVIALGADVHDFAMADRVVALTLFGGYSSRLRVPADQVFALPTALNAMHAAGLPTVFLTAWFMTTQQVLPRPGDIWLVHSAAGGVGSALCQLGRLAGCRVIGVVGATHKIAHAAAMGATMVIDKSVQDPWCEVRRLAPEGCQAIFDANGVSTLARSYAHLAVAGKLCVYGFASMLPRNGRLNWLALARDWLRTPRFNPLDMTRFNRSVLACNLSFLAAEAPRLAEGMRWLLERFADRRLQPLPVQTFTLAQAADAQRRIESGQSVGKLVLIP
ncbi:MAG TPA: zinc-binding dehydrogenase [Rhodanobacteraceae bacterium]|nr:zinc-binding dehydrogenase [Rhodanobacteraceae bacterium]